MIRISPKLANISHLLLNAGATYNLGMDEWFAPDSLLALVNQVIEDADYDGCYFPRLFKNSCSACGSNLHILKQFDVANNGYSYSYKCESINCSGKADALDIYSVFTTKKKYSLHFDDTDLGIGYHRYYCKNCAEPVRMNRAYYYLDFWLVCENSEECGTFFVETEQNRQKYIQTAYLTRDDIIRLSLSAFNFPPPTELIWKGFESFHLSDLHEKYTLETKQLSSSLDDFGFDFAEHPRTARKSDFLLLALYLSNMNVAAAIRLCVCKATYMKKEQPIFQICRTPGGAEFVMSALRKKSEEVNSYRAMLKLRT